MLSRRAWIGQLVAVAGLAGLKRHGHAAAAPASAAVSAMPPTGRGLTVELSFADGSTLMFDQGKATDVGDYVGPFVHQKCLMQRQGAWTAFFRPDADGSRQEVVIEYGSQYDFSTVPPKPADDVAPAHITAPYSATIKEGNTVRTTITVPNHWWRARWRWQSAPRPIRRTYADLVAMKAILPLDASQTWNAKPPKSGAAWTGPMNTGGIAHYMPETGDRDDIGFITEAQACYLITGDAKALETVMTWGEAMGSVPVFIRDLAATALLDVQAHPYLCATKDGDTFKPRGSHTIPQAPPVSTPPPKTFITPDASHFPALSFVPWLLTDDPWHLEGAQAAALFSILETNGGLGHTLPGIVARSQQRAIAWGLRDILRMAAFAPASPPKWLLGKADWQKCAADNLVWINADMIGDFSNNGAVNPSWVTAAKNFHLVPEFAWKIVSFENDYLMIVIGWVGWSGFFQDWSDSIKWLAGQRLAISADPAVAGPGWDRRWPVVYDWTVPSPVPASWEDLWKAFTSTYKFPSPPSTWPADTLTHRVGGYILEARGALAALAQAGLSRAQTEHDWLRSQMAATVPPSVSSPFKWAFRPPR